VGHDFLGLIFPNEFGIVLTIQLKYSSFKMPDLWSGQGPNPEDNK